ncbi:MAG: Uma2 family endonuclease [Hormoscilla sp. GM102CHS1]|nr:Uma2 family endonuclease [Hormoscilla sp. GM102CHS1]
MNELATRSGNPPLPPLSNPPLSPRQTLPTMYDLPSEDPEEIRMPDEYHGLQSFLLRCTFLPGNFILEQVFVGTDLNIYYDRRNLNWYKRPDWFAVVGVERLYDGHDMRDSYVMWQELVSPFVIVELLSPSTENEDLGQRILEYERLSEYGKESTVRQPGNPPTKWEVYEQILRVPYYIVFTRYTNELQIFHLVGDRYKPAPLSNGRFLIPQLKLSLGLWRGSYEGIDRLWLRWFTADGELILTPDEKAAAAQQRVERLAAKLRELNIDPDSL